MNASCLWPGCRSPEPARLLRRPQLTLEHNDGEVLGGLGFAGGEALVGPGVALLGRGDEQGLVAEPADGDGLVGQQQLGVAVPANGELRGAREGAGEDDRAANAGLQLLWCQGHMKRVCARPGRGEARENREEKERKRTHCEWSVARSGLWSQKSPGVRRP